MREFNLYIPLDLPRRDRDLEQEEEEERKKDLEESSSSILLPCVRT